MKQSNTYKICFFVFEHNKIQTFNFHTHRQYRIYPYIKIEEKNYLFVDIFDEISTNTCSTNNTTSIIYQKTYSTEPQNPNGIGSLDTLAYPPSDKWDMSMKNDGCDTIIYDRTFTWQELRECSGFDGTPLPQLKK